MRRRLETSFAAQGWDDSLLVYREEILVLVLEDRGTGGSQLLEVLANDVALAISLDESFSRVKNRRTLPSYPPSNPDVTVRIQSALVGTLFSNDAGSIFSTRILQGASIGRGSDPHRNDTRTRTGIQGHDAALR
ncbi:uncharacterized protein ARMOST_21423 [Armillaria ostoyae]|uniref:Uncharacterized protein n=1 Tax=Armillaria ostoyae TaxID=47428 RepID=A0A284SA49_ARMOS|nr:uncharacterized protein ARMOST_21423 [Armillaria ostoyae]